MNEKTNYIHASDILPQVVEEAKKELERIIKDIDNLVEDSISIEPQFHRHFVAHRGEVTTSMIYLPTWEFITWKISYSYESPNLTYICYDMLL